MMNQEFDTINTYEPTGLNGWFRGFCPSNKIADGLNNQARGVQAQRAAWSRKYNSLKNGRHAAEWESLKREVRRLEQQIKRERQKLAQEKEVASALGLGAFCKKAISKRRKAEETLRSAANSLGRIRGAFQTLERQQRDGIRQANTVVANNKNKLLAIKQEITNTKKKIATYKAQRDHKAKAVQNSTPATINKAKKENVVGKLKENSPLLIGGIAVAAAWYYLSKKKTKKPTAKSVTA